MDAPPCGGAGRREGLDGVRERDQDRARRAAGASGANRSSIEPGTSPSDARSTSARQAATLARSAPQPTSSVPISSRASCWTSIRARVAASELARLQHALQRGPGHEGAQVGVAIGERAGRRGLREALAERGEALSPGGVDPLRLVGRELVVGSAQGGGEQREIAGRLLREAEERLRGCEQRDERTLGSRAARRPGPVLGARGGRARAVSEVDHDRSLQLGDERVLRGEVAVEGGRRVVELLGDLLQRERIHAGLAGERVGHAHDLLHARLALARDPGGVTAGFGDIVNHVHKVT